MSLGIVCSGQGVQSAGMLAQVQGLAEACALLAQAGRLIGADIAALCAADDPRLYDNQVAQPLLCAIQCATWAVLAPLLPPPRLFAGYSIGEIAAAACAGALSPADGIALARRRAQVMDAACDRPNGLAAVRGLGQTRLRSLCARHGVWVAIDTAPDRKVVGGLLAALDGFCAEAESLGATVTRLCVRIASHTPLMENAVEPLRDALAALSPVAPAIPVLAGIDGGPVLNAERLITVLARQVAEPVLWGECMTGLREMGCRVVLELGPGDSLTRMLRDHDPDLPARSVSEFRDLVPAAAWVRNTLSTL